MLLPPCSSWPEDPTLVTVVTTLKCIFFDVDINGRMPDFTQCFFSLAGLERHQLISIVWMDSYD